MNQPSEIAVLFSDEALLVVNKPAGLSTLPDGYNPSQPHLKSVLEHQFGPLWIVHRLDKDTTGVLLLARTAEAHRSLNTQFEQHKVSKVYHALVVGSPDWQEQTISLPLRPNGDRQHRTVVDSQTGKPAVTHLKVLERFGNYCLVEAIPETGRTHQIRAHLNTVSLSILGDKLYGKRNTRREGRTSQQTQEDSNSRIEYGAGMGLHAASLEIIHPLSGEKMKFNAPYPVSFTEVLKQLRSPAQGG